MNNKLSKSKYITIFLIGISAASIPATVSAGWSIYGLGTLGGSKSQATDINNSGQVVGTSTLFGDTTSIAASRAFITGSNGVGMTTLDTLGERYSSATGINDSGQVIGVYYTDVGLHSFITGPNGVAPTDLGALNGMYGENSGLYYEFNFARGINESGQVVGEDGDAPLYKSDAFMTGSNGVGMIRLEIPGTFVGANAINDSGQVLGYSFEFTSGGEYSFITGPNGKGMTIIENLGGRIGGSRSINNLGQVVGGSYIPGDTEYHAFITGPNGEGITDLGTLGGTWADAIDINDSGQVIGNSATANGSYHAFLFTNNEMIDLSVLSSVIDAGWTDIGVIAINDHGQIAGSGKLHGNTQAFLLSPFPVPEPSTYAMLLAGLGLVGFMGRAKY